MPRLRCGLRGDVGGCADLRVPLLVLHGEDDQIHDLNASLNLYKTAKSLVGYTHPHCFARFRRETLVRRVD